MIRTLSIQFKAGDVPLIVQLGWYDPEVKLLRTHMAKWTVEAIKAFETRSRLVGGNFSVEMMCKFISERTAEQIGEGLALVQCADAKNGIGVEWRKEMTPQLRIEHAGDVSHLSDSSLRDRALGANQGDDGPS